MAFFVLLALLRIEQSGLLHQQPRHGGSVTLLLAAEVLNSSLLSANERSQALDKLDNGCL